jgi:hypothetical protein
MADKREVIRVLEETGVIAILRTENAGVLSAVAKALYEGGIKLIEITMTIPGALDILNETVKALDGKDVYIGMGTVLDAETARLAILSGAAFIVSPGFDKETVDICRSYNVLSMPGAFTPNEIITAWKGGGDMVKTVSFDKTTYADLPYKFEAGTANYIGAIGLAVAIDFVNSIGLSNINDAEKRLLHYATERLQQIDGVRIIGNAANKAPLISLIINDLHHLDVGQILDHQGIAVRTGTLCAEPVMRRYGLTGMLRASFAFCNTNEDVSALAAGIELAVKMLK